MRCKLGVDVATFLPVDFAARLAASHLAGSQPGVWLERGGELMGRLDYLESHLVVQLDDRFVPINLGDGGRMFVFPDTAFWQCS
ncbi:MAG: hypothetical protein AB7S26_18275 [Sandaracinaceae bacterium]